MITYHNYLTVIIYLMVLQYRLDTYLMTLSVYLDVVKCNLIIQIDVGNTYLRKGNYIGDYEMVLILLTKTYYKY